MGPLRYRVRYASYRDLDADHAAYFTHGGYVMRLTGRDAAEPNRELVMVLEGPDGAAFELAARSGQTIPGRGFMLTFEPRSEAARGALDAYVGGPAFREACAAEPEDGPGPEIARIDETEPTSTGADGLEGPSADAAPTPGPAVDDLGLDSLDLPDDGSGDVAAEDDDASPISPPGPGQEYPIYAVKFEQVSAFAEIAPGFDASARFDVAIEEPRFGPDDVALLRLTLPGRNIFEMWTRLEDVAAERVRLRVSRNDEQFRKAVLHLRSPSARSRTKREADEPPTETKAIRIEAAIPEEDREKMPLRRRLQRMGMDEKINLALSGDRQERMALATDSNKAVHHYLLKNAKITLDEIANMARLPSLNPDVLEKIADNPQYTQNPSVAKALAYNPKTPVRTAIRMLDRLPRNEVAILAKRTNLNGQLVKAAKKKIGE